MKHPRSIDLGRPRRDAITYLGPITDPAEKTLGGFQQWDALGLSCPKCEREAWIDREALLRKWGNAYLNSLQPRLRCLACGNREGNRWIHGRLPR